MSARKPYPSDLTALQWHNIRHLFPGGDRPPKGPGRPRTATVVAQTDLSLAALGRKEFGWLVHASGETVGEFRARTAHYVGSAGLGAAVRGA